MKTFESWREAYVDSNEEDLMVCSKVLGLIPSYELTTYLGEFNGK